MINHVHAYMTFRPTAECLGVAVRSDRRAQIPAVLTNGWNFNLGSGVH
jgi:hypothetical protein